MRKNKEKLRSIVIDTLTMPQTDSYVEKELVGKSSFTDWKDYSISVFNCVNAYRILGYQIVLIVGYEGSGKTYGMRNLDPFTNIWINTDKKNTPWKEGIEIYGTKFSPKKPYMMLTTSYEDIVAVGKKAIEGNMFGNNPPIAFFTGHIEDYQAANNKKRQRLKTLGNLNKSLGIEGLAEMVYYAEVVQEMGKNKYIYRFKNSGTDTARTFDGLHSEEEVSKGYIENDMKKIITDLYNYWEIPYEN